ncbi:TetR family transcriptional regulator [Enterococcus florum]|uniref:TetR family transcriptional regulator n=1 Tax=Enterococcus florum TaxID=2480627 RepID=A0A4P5PCP2_9ENTE|nr:TetR/AcrR family transcriptional regulator [Enterococcus florum]GCF95910.1 TetR family transcriptional regulator [Enterococcus florum]
MTETMRSKQKKETRQNILNTARQLFAEQGFTIATSKIAKEAGISHGSLFQHFPKREHLIQAVIQDFFDQLNSKTDELTKNSATIEAFLRMHLKILQEQEEFYSQLIREQQQFSNDIQAKLFANYSTLSFHMIKIIEKQTKLKLAPHMYFNTWNALLSYYILNKVMFSPQNSVLQSYGEELIETYLTMMFSEERNG